MMVLFYRVADLFSLLAAGSAFTAVWSLVFGLSSSRHYAFCLQLCFAALTVFFGNVIFFSQLWKNKLRNCGEAVEVEEEDEGGETYEDGTSCKDADSGNTKTAAAEGATTAVTTKKRTLTKHSKISLTVVWMWDWWNGTLLFSGTAVFLSFAGFVANYFLIFHWFRRSLYAVAAQNAGAVNPANATAVGADLDAAAAGSGAVAEMLIDADFWRTWFGLGDLAAFVNENVPLTKVGAVVAAGYNFLLFMAIWAHWSAATTDPGFVQSYVPTKNRATPARWCKVCEQPKPDRGHHCKVCNRCIFRMDHHCPWINNCVGWNNQRLFMQFTFYVMSLSVASLLLELYVLFAYSQLATTPPWSNAGVACGVLLCAESFFFLFFVVDFLSEQVEAISTNSTLVETYQAKRGRLLPFREAARETFGEWRCLWWLPMANPSDPDYEEPVYMDPGTAHQSNAADVETDESSEEEEEEDSDEEDDDQDHAGRGEGARRDSNSTSPPTTGKGGSKGGGEKDAMSPKARPKAVAGGGAAPTSKPNKAPSPKWDDDVRGKAEKAQPATWSNYQPAKEGAHKQAPPEKPEVVRSGSSSSRIQSRDSSRTGAKEKVKVEKIPMVDEVGSEGSPGGRSTSSPMRSEPGTKPEKRDPVKSKTPSSKGDAQPATTPSSSSDTLATDSAAGEEDNADATGGRNWLPL
mmetsp:Transcript_27490/g.69333  ORF Transcript_27490/g.69333 Transcript_27490/m.69333 type:complete len:688 (+) Transcript_27490:297-2360(+)